MVSNLPMSKNNTSLLISSLALPVVSTYPLPSNGWNDHDFNICLMSLPSISSLKPPAVPRMCLHDAKTVLPLMFRRNDKPASEVYPSLSVILLEKMIGGSFWNLPI